MVGPRITLPWDVVAQVLGRPYRHNDSDDDMLCSELIARGVTLGDRWDLDIGASDEGWYIGPRINNR